MTPEPEKSDPDMHDRPAPHTEHTPWTAPYTVLAPVYDAVMAHVDYDLWAEYVHRRLHERHPAPRSILELGCGTGALTFALQPLGDYDYLATDGSSAMIDAAREKAAARDVPVRFAVMDFTAVDVAERADAVLLLYDGLNYLLDLKDVRALLEGAYRALRPGGLFLFDQSTPANSINNAALFEDRGRVRDVAYVRRSRYDPTTRLHTTTFELSTAGTLRRERHVQRAYAVDEIRACIRETEFEVVAAYDGFSTAPATETTERVHWLLRRG